MYNYFFYLQIFFTKNYKIRVIRGQKISKNFITFAKKILYVINLPQSANHAAVAGAQISSFCGRR
jgi:hypothetical protein